MKQPLTAAALGVAAETEAKLRDFAALLLRWNRRINLVATHNAEEAWHRHVLDSLQLLPLLPPGDGPLTDLGSGAGFPGLVLAAASGRETHLVESDKRKSAFLLEAARSMGLARVRVHAQRIEAATPPPAAVLTARALAPLAELLRLGYPLLAEGGIALFPKGQMAEQELTAASPLWNMRVECFPSRTDSAATILRLSEIRPRGESL